MYLGEDAYDKDVHGTKVTVRDPWRVGMLCLVTLGFYGPVWFYFVNQELDLYAKARGEPRVGGSPALAVVGVTFGALLVLPAIATWVWTLIRIARAQQLEGVAPMRLGPTLLFAVAGLIPIAGIVVWHEYVQREINAIWCAADDGHVAAPSFVPVPSLAGA